jgi:hypothetical protein
VVPVVLTYQHNRDLSKKFHLWSNTEEEETKRSVACSETNPIIYSCIILFCAMFNNLTVLLNN